MVNFGITIYSKSNYLSMFNVPNMHMAYYQLLMVLAHATFMFYSTVMAFFNQHFLYNCSSEWWGPWSQLYNGAWIPWNKKWRLNQLCYEDQLEELTSKEFWMKARIFITFNLGIHIPPFCFKHLFYLLKITTSHLSKLHIWLLFYCTNQSEIPIQM